MMEIFRFSGVETNNWQGKVGWHWGDTYKLRSPIVIQRGESMFDFDGFQIWFRNPWEHWHSIHQPGHGNITCSECRKWTKEALNRTK